jgi:hypothetical protein
MALERRLAKKPCPRDCGGYLLAGERAKYNVKSRVDGLQICVDCFVEELKTMKLGY